MPGGANVVLFAILIATGLLLVNNVFGDATEVIELARSVACGNTVCSPELTSTDRGPIHQRLRFSVERLGSVDVACQRTYWVAGAYACSLVRLDDRNSLDFRY